MSKKHHLLLSLFLILFSAAEAQIPGGFYAPSPEGKKEAEKMKKEPKLPVFLEIQPLNMDGDTLPVYFQLPSPEKRDTSSIPNRMNGGQGSAEGRAEEGVVARLDDVPPIQGSL